MIRLIDLLFEQSPESDEKSKSVWRVQDSGRFGARNTQGQIRYFWDEDKARDFAAGKIKGPKIGRPKPKQKPEKAKAKEKYDIR